MSVKNIISQADFTAMKNEFDNTIVSKLGTQKTSSVWWSYDNLVDYLALIEDEAKKKGLTLTGVNFNMVAQTTGAKSLSLALTPTYRDGDSKASNQADQSGSILNKGIVRY